MKKENIDVITIGSATVDIFLKNEEWSKSKSLKFAEKNEVKKVLITTGGGATNSAVTFSNLGLKVKSIFSIGNDYYGKIIRKDLTEKGVKTSLMQINEKEKTSFSVIITAKERNRMIFSYRGASNQLDWKRIDWKRVNSNMFYITSLGGNFKLLTQIFSKAELYGLKIAWNPGFKEIEKGLTALIPFLKKTDFLFLNLKEAELMGGVSLLAEERLIKKIKSYTKGFVIITLGKKGARIYDGKDILYKKAFESNKKYIDSTGAGDAFGSGFAGMFYRTNNIEKSFSYALENSAFVTTELGAKEGLIKQ